MEKRTERLQICLNDSEVAAIDEWRFQHRLPSRSATVRELIGRGLTGGDAHITDGVSSQDIGVIDSELDRPMLSAYCIADARAPDHPLIYVSPGFERLTGYSAAEAVGRNCRFLQGPDTDKITIKKLGEAVRRGEPFACDLINYRKNGAPFMMRLAIEPAGGAADGSPAIIIGRQAALSPPDMTGASDEKKWNPVFRHTDATTKESMASGDFD